jgi:hypothetical protein
VGKVAFIWDGQYYGFTRACFGLKTMTAKFQSKMATIVREVSKGIAYVDDVLISTGTVDELIASNRKFLTIFNKYSIKVNFILFLFGGQKGSLIFPSRSNYLLMRV